MTGYHTNSSLWKTRLPEFELKIVTVEPSQDFISVWVTQSSFDMLLLSYKTNECLASQSTQSYTRVSSLPLSRRVQS